MKTKMIWGVFWAIFLSACAAQTPDMPTLVPTDEVVPASATVPTATKTPIPAQPTATPPEATLAPVEPNLTPVPTRTLIPLPSTTPGTPITPTKTPTPSVPMAFSSDGNAVTCYTGPGTEYAVFSSSRFKKDAEIVGKDQTGKWWYVKITVSAGNYVYCWVQEKKVSTGGNLSKVRTIQPDVVALTAVNIYLDKGDYTVTTACDKKADALVFRFRGEIVSTGPIKAAKYIWESNTGTKFKQEQATIRAWDDPAQIKLNLSVPAKEGTYSLTLRTIYPTALAWTVQFAVKCK